MGKTGKKYKIAKEKLESSTMNSWEDVLRFVVENKHTQFDESVDADFVLGIDTSKGDQNVRGSVLLPHGVGKKVCVLAFVKGEHENEAKSAGADFVGVEDLIEKIQGGWFDFDVAVATPDLMGMIGKIAKILGPKGLLPNKKDGTVTSDIASIVSDLKKGRIAFKNDKSGLLHVSFGRVSFGVEKLLENLKALVKVIKSCKPASSKGMFVKKMSISSSMGVGISFSPDELV
jgi:large subunit ribosomal protein L1